MESIVSFFATLGIDFFAFAKLACILLAGALLINGINRFIFRKQTLLSQAVSSSIAIIFIYVLMVLIMTVVTQLRFLATDLPFVTISMDSLRFFRFQEASYASIAAELLSMIVLAFLVNLIDSWMPKRKHLLKWTLWRCFTVILGFTVHYLATWLLNRYLPQGIVMYAPAFLVAILVIMLLTGALRFLLGLILATVNPLIGALYTFFFASVIGKHVTRAVFTTAILSAVVLLLEDLGITSLSLMAGALVAYIPFLLILVVVWYLVSLL